MRVFGCAATVGVLSLAAIAGSPALAQQDDPAFAACVGCHSLTSGKNGVGPSLHGVVGSKPASVPGYAYSGALKAKGGAWTAASLDAYLTDPSKDVPGTKMPVGVKDPAKRAAVIALLKKAR